LIESAVRASERERSNNNDDSIIDLDELIQVPARSLPHPPNPLLYKQTPSPSGL